MRSLPERRGMVENAHPGLSITAQCKLLTIHRSGCYYTPSVESQENLEIMRILDRQYFDTPFYGVERLLCTLTLLGRVSN